MTCCSEFSPKFREEHTTNYMRGVIYSPGTNDCSFLIRKESGANEINPTLCREGMTGRNSSAISSGSRLKDSRTSEHLPM